MLWFAAYVLGFPAAFGIVTVWVSAGIRYALGALLGLRQVRE
jgi:hypothetical protein